MKKQFKKIICMTLSVIMLLSVLPVMSSAFLKGDLDENGRITALDARTALRIAAKLMAFEEVFIDMADMDGNNKITANDARTILRIAARLDGEQSSGQYTPQLDDNGYVILDDAIGMDIDIFKSYMSMGQRYGDPSYVIWGNSTKFVLEGSGTANPDAILMFDITDKGCSYKGMTVGMTKAQVLDAFGEDGFTETDMANLSSYKTILDGNNVVFDFVGNTVSSIFVKSMKGQLVYDVLAMTGRTDREVFPPESADYATETTADGCIVYTLSGVRAFVFDEYYGNYVRAVIVNEKNDYSFDGIYIGDEFSKVTAYAEKHGIRTSTGDSGADDLVFDMELSTVYFSETDGKVSRIFIVAKGYEDKI